jgi:SAM-dependent methyltransferase
MSRRTASISSDYFEALYEGGRDPWRFASSAYERDKYAATLAAIGPERIGRACEVGCAIGIFTQALAGQCASLLAVDAADNALIQARDRCAELTNVTFQRMCIPDDWPSGSFELIVFSEILYYLVPDDIRLAAKRSLRSLSAGGRVVLVHWTGETDYPVTGDEAATLFLEACGGRVTALRHERQEAYRLDVVQAEISAN